MSDPWASPRSVEPTLPAPPEYPVAYAAPVWSDKNKIIAGLLQTVPGFLIALGGLGRLYAGHRGLGVAQLVVTLLGWISFFCGFVLVVPWFFTSAAWLWFVVDGIVLMAGRPVDGHGRPLRT